MARSVASAHHRAVCCFSGPVEHVSGTKIFARPLAGGDQLLAYSMSFGAARELAMILPLPVPPGPSDDAVEFISLQGYERFFDDLAAAFPSFLVMSRSKGALGVQAGRAPTLVVHEVGDFVASFVPTLADFERLDPRFRLDPTVWERLPRYRDWGFAVFELAPKRLGLWARLFGGPGRQTVHPMAFRFPRRDPRTLFFPTVHVHDGAVHETAGFDHTLYCQPDAITAATFGWQESGGPIGRWVDPQRSGGLIDPDAPAYRQILHGPRRNLDQELIPPRLESPATLRYRDDVFELRLQARAAYFEEGDDGPFSAWRTTARDHLEAVSSHLRSSVGEILRAGAPGWGLGRYDDSLPLYRNEGDRVTSTAALSVSAAPPPGERLRVEFAVTDGRVEPQLVRVAFEDVPTAEVLREVRGGLERALASLRL